MKIGIADTTFARVNMAEFAINIIKKNSKHEISSNYKNVLKLLLRIYFGFRAYSLLKGILYCPNLQLFLKSRGSNLSLIRPP